MISQTESIAREQDRETLQKSRLPVPPLRLLRLLLGREYLARWLPQRLRLRAWRWLGVKVSEDAFLAASAKLACFLDRIHIGEGSLIGCGAELYAWEEIQIGRRVLISQGAKLLTGSHDYNNPSLQGLAHPIRVGDFAWIGAYALILPGIEIGEGAVVGAGAVVSRNVPPYAIVAGNPAHIIGHRKQSEFNYIPAQFP
ncbi:MAG: acyltransferase [Armatimonadetes bacterium]|nr:acyltransferase [Armatimonadota bacterium]NIM24833.1 acyltransferase [Armatimonadota bacterium]NIM68723.1 acyltransferase [Armatimonadota bacterium]NIM76016.1 acyltransferase [Armatimonadota bacterium]NIN06920.1 acyltransferase [Armatimonadota bacterium]